MMKSPKSEVSLARGSSSFKKVRCKTGCFTCRFRKKKCDERRTVCKNCDRNSLNCIWPSHGNETLPKDFKLSGNSSNFVIKTVYEPHSSSTSSDLKSPNIDAFSPHQSDMLSLNSTSLFSMDDDSWNPSSAVETTPESHFTQSDKTAEFMCSKEDILCSSADSSSQNFEVSPLLDFSSPQFNWIPNFKLNKDDAYLYHLFVTQFIPSISPSHAHPSLTPKAVFVPQGLQSDILLHIFFACGATILAYNRPEYRDLAQQKYLECIKLIQNVIVNDEVEGTEDWLFVSVQSLCLRERAFGANASRCAKHLTASYNIIKKRLELQLVDRELKDIVITPIEKCLLESFIFNYSITILLCKIEDLNLLPNPFVFFQIYNPLLEKPIYSNCLVKWMNNPVMGAAFISFEVAAKASYLFRQITQVDTQPPLSSHSSPPYPSTLVISRYNTELIQQLQHDISHFQPSELSSECKSSPHYSVLAANITISKLIITASSVLLSKLIDPNLAPTSYELQNKLKLIIKELKSLPNDEHSSCLTIWSILIMGTIAVTYEDQNFLRKKLSDIGELIRANAALQVGLFLEKCWARDSVDEMFGMIFDRRSLEIICA